MEASHFAPDSVYATWSAGQRAAADRMEAQFNSRRSTVIETRAQALAHPVPSWPDDILRRTAKRLRRSLEDIADGDESEGKRPLVMAQLRDVEAEQERRAALTEYWAASGDGTHCYSAFQGRGGVLAVREDRAVPPSYDLAHLLDWEAWRRGAECALDWQG